MARRPTPAVYRRRRLVVGVGAVAVVVLLVWVVVIAVSAMAGSHAKAPGIASASQSVAAQADNTPTISVPVVPVGGKCDAGDIVVKPVSAMAHVNGAVSLAFQVFTKQNPTCVWKATHGSVQVTINAPGTPSFWSTSSCPTAVKEQTVTLHRATPVTLTLAIWNGQASSLKSGCGSQNPWAVPGLYGVYAAALGGNPYFGALRMVAPGVVLVQPTPSVSATATPSAKSTTKPKSTAKSPTPAATPSTSTW